MKCLVAVTKKIQRVVQENLKLSAEMVRAHKNTNYVPCYRGRGNGELMFCDSGSGRRPATN